jgi:hypothetical protein
MNDGVRRDKIAVVLLFTGAGAIAFVLHAAAGGFARPIRTRVE